MFETMGWGTVPDAETDSEEDMSFDDDEEDTASIDSELAELKRVRIERILVL